MEDPRIRKFAQFLIRSAVGLEKGEKILIELHGSETGLMKSLVQEAYAVGGKPFVHIFDYAVEGALVQGADAEHMEEIASYELERMRDMDAYIDIRATTNISMWHNVSDEAQRRYRQYYWGPIHLSERCNHTKWSVLRYPNDAMAQLAGVSTEEYEDFYFRACLVDYDKMGRAMQPLQDLMARTDKVRIVAPGTDISFSIKGGRSEAVKFMDKLELASNEVHVADIRTCVLHPASATHRQLSDEQLVAAGIDGGLIRFSVGLENVDDIIADIKQAFDRM